MIGRRKRALDGLDEDIRDHIERETQDNIARGMTLEDAYRRAVLKFGSVASIKEDTRAVWGWQRLAQIKQDIRYSLRALRRHPTYALLSILTLALGIGSTACVYGVARGVLFAPLPFRNERDVGVFWKKQDWSHQEYLFIRGRVPGFSQVALYRTPHVILRDGDRPAQLAQSVFASSELFDVLGVAPLLGRGIRADDNAAGAEPVAIVSYSLWQELGGTPSIIGRRLTLDGTTRTIVGVMPRGFWFPNPSVRLWIPEQLNPELKIMSSTLIGRVAPNQDVRAMDASVAQLTAMLRERFDYRAPQWDKTKAARITPVRDDIVGPMRPAVLATLGGIAVILLIACANVGALTLGYISARSPEFAVRAALGANRERLARQMVSEVLVITTLAGLLGGALAWLGFPVVVRALPLGIWAGFTAPDWSVLASAMGIAVAAALPVMLVPAVSLLRRDLRGALNASRAAGIEGRGGGLENSLVIAQVALAVMLAAGSALLARSVANLYHIEPGVRTEGVAIVDVVLPGSGRAGRVQTLTEMATALRAMPGVRSVGTVQTPPLADVGNYRMELSIDGRPEIQGVVTQYRIVTPEYFETIGMHLRRGRWITEADERGTERVVLVNEAFSRKFLGGADPIGQLLGGDMDAPARVVGVVANVTETGLTDEPQPTRYAALAQMSWVDDEQSLVLRAAPGVDEMSLLEPARRLVARVAPGVAIQQATTMRHLVESAMGPARQVVMLLSLLTALALILGAVGVYGVITQFAARHRREWAIRVALGLEGSRLVVRVLRHGVTLVSFGIVLGIAGALGLTRLLSSFLYRVSAIDPAAFAAAGASLLAVGTAAALLPAWRAGRADPLIALREQ